MTETKSSSDLQREHAAWLERLSTDERMMCSVPIGYQYELLFIAHIKRQLLTCEMSAGERLYLLEGITKMVDGYLTQEMVTMIEPACATAAKMFQEALALDRDSERGEGSFKMVTSFEVFGHFVRLNPSILEAIRLRHGDEDQFRPRSPAVCAHRVIATSYSD